MTNAIKDTITAREAEVSEAQVEAPNAEIEAPGAEVAVQKHVLTFADEPALVWKKVNANTRKGKRAPDCYDLVFAATNHIDERVENILELCKTHASPETRFNGLSVLRKMGTAVLKSAGSALASGVRNHYLWFNLSGAMHEIVSAMSLEERRAIYNDESSPKALWPRLLEFKKETRAYCLFEFGSGNSINDVTDLIAQSAKDTNEKDHEAQHEKVQAREENKENYIILE